MFKYGLFEVVKYGREAEDKAYRERAAQILKRYGLEEKIWQVDGRTIGQVFLEWGPFESRQHSGRTSGKRIILSDEEYQLQANALAMQKHPRAWHTMLTHRMR